MYCVMQCGCIFHRYEKGRVIIRAGHKGEFVYFVYNGSASVTIEYIVDDVANATMKPGTIFGVCCKLMMYVCILAMHFKIGSAVQ